MKRIARISAAIVGMVVVCAALGVGAWWIFAALPAPTALPDLAAEGGAVAASVVPRMATIPWKRDPEVLPAMAVTPIPVAGVKGQKQPRPVPSWWTPPASVPNVAVESGVLEAILHLVTSGDAGEQAQGVAKIEDMVRTNPEMVARMMAGAGGGQVWSGPLLAAKRFGDVDRVASEVMVAVAFNVDLLEGLCAVRVMAAVGEGKDPEARLREWFAISSLRGTGAVLVQMRKLLKVTAAEHFTVDPEDAEAKRFAGAAGGMDGEDYAALLSRANLWLLAGKADAAEAVFRRAYMVAPEPQVEAAAENFARVVKAKTGSVEETNKWLQEHGK